MKVALDNKKEAEFQEIFISPYYGNKIYLLSGEKPESSFYFTQKIEDSEWGQDSGIEFHYICKDCKEKLLDGRLPSMAAANGLHIPTVPEELQLCELGESLIARRIMFQKILRLPSSLMPGITGKIVNVPINEENIKNTLNALPRTPSEAGIVPMGLKRMMKYKNPVKQSMIEIEKLFECVQYLKNCGHPSYQFVEDLNIDNYQKKCQEEDLELADTLFQTSNKNDKDVSPMETSEEDCTSSSLPNCPSGLCKTAQHTCRRCLARVCNLCSYPDPENEMHRWHTLNCIDPAAADQKEKEYRENDVIRKFQIDYNQSTTYTPRFPQAFHKEQKIEKKDAYFFAPGEGKIPENILTTKDWDRDAFPMKHPNGKYNLHHERKSGLYEQRYFIQRIRNWNPIFRNDPSYVFSAIQYIQKKQLQKNINVSFLRGKKTITESGKNIYSLEDAFSVFENTSNTPSYHKQGKYEMMARLDNLGGFQFFFTLSCADMRWEENITAVLREKNLRITYEINSENGEGITIVHFGCDQSLELEEYLKTEEGQSIHEILRRNVITATRNYRERFLAFV